MRILLLIKLLLILAACADVATLQSRRMGKIESLSAILPEFLIDDGKGYANKSTLDVTVQTESSLYHEVNFGIAELGAEGVANLDANCSFGAWQAQQSNPYVVSIPPSFAEGPLEICLVLRNKELEESQIQRKAIVLDLQAPRSLIADLGSSTNLLMVKDQDTEGPLFTIHSSLMPDTSGIKFIEVSIQSPQSKLCLNAAMSQFNVACPHWHLAELAVSNDEWSLTVPKAAFDANLDYSVSLRGADNAGNFLQEDAVAVLDGGAISEIPPSVEGQVALEALAEDTNRIVNLSYTDANGDLALSCETDDLENVQIVNACQCDKNGVCSLEIAGLTNYSGSASFQYRVQANGSWSNFGKVTLNISEVDDAPTVEDLTPSAINEDTPAIITLVYNDVENHSASACEITSLVNLTIANACACNLGTCTVGVQGTADYFGSASFAYRVTANGMISSTATVTLSITDVADFLVFGSGLDGSATVNTALDINSESIGASLDRNGAFADGFALRVSDISGATITTSHSGVGAFVAGDRVLLINLQGSSTDYVDAGKYELLKVSAVDATTITLEAAPSLSYDGTLASYVDQVVAIQRVPEYQNLTVTGSGSITASAWDRLATAPSGNVGMKTGIVALAVSGTLSVQAGGKIHANGLGYQGLLSTSTGESIRQSIAYAPASSTANIGGGGQNTYVGPTCWNNGIFGGGGGGGHGDLGATPTVPTNNASTYNGAGGEAYGEPDLSLLFYGSSGGNCYAPYCGAPWAVAGSGGGIVFIAAHTINNAGSIESLGANATNLNDCCGGTKSGGPGGGAGGSIKIISEVATAGTLLATGGLGGKGPTRLAWACGEGAEDTRGGTEL